jgi:anthranilate phosphoribosyltransferase
VKRQLVGVFSPEWVEPLAHVLKGLGTEAAWVVHGDGLDELTTAGPTKVAALRDGKVRSFEIVPEEVGLARAEPADLKGGDAVRNAEALRAVLDGVKGPYRDIVLLNAGAAILVAGKGATLQEGIAIAVDAIDSGKARAALTKLVEVSNRPG